MKKLLVGLMVLVILVSIPIAVSAKETAEVLADLGYSCGIEVTPPATGWCSDLGLVYTMNTALDPAVVRTPSGTVGTGTCGIESGDPDTAGNVWMNAISVEAYGTRKHSISSHADPHADGSIDDTMVAVRTGTTWEFDAYTHLKNYLYMQTQSETPYVGFDNTWHVVTGWTESEATGGLYTYSINLDQPYEYTDLLVPDTWEGFGTIITFSATCPA